MATNINGLAPNMSQGATWLSGNAATPTQATAPIVLDTQLRGALRCVSGAAGDQLTDIPGQMLENGMLAYVVTGYTAVCTTS